MLITYKLSLASLITRVLIIAPLLLVAHTGMTKLVDSFSNDLVVYQQQGDCIRSYLHQGYSRASIEPTKETKETLGVSRVIGTCTLK